MIETSGASALRLVQILAVPPVFDLALGIALTEAQRGTQSAGIGIDDETMRRLVMSGVILKGDGWWRVVEPLRHQLLASLRDEDPDTYRSLAYKLSDASRNGAG